MQAAVVPVKPAKSDNPARHRLAISHQRFVVDLQKALGRQHPSPVTHEPGILLPIERDRIAIVGEIGEVAVRRHVDRQAGVQRVPAAMDDAGTRQDQVDEPEQQKIGRHLIGDAERAGRHPAQNCAIVGGG